MSEHLIDAEKVEEIFMTWVNDLITNHGDKAVGRVLGSPAIQSMFTGDVGQSVRDEPEPTAIEVGGVRMEYGAQAADAVRELAAAVRFHAILGNAQHWTAEDINIAREHSREP